MDLSECSITNDGGAFIASSLNFSNLEDLYLNKCNLVTDIGLTAIANSSNSSNLINIDISRYLKITDESILYLLTSKYLPKLKTVDLSYSSKITLNLILNIIEQYPNVKIKHHFNKEFIGECLVLKRKKMILHLI